MTENPVRPRTLTTRGYDPSPHYPVRGGEVALGWAPAAATLPGSVRVLAVDGPAVLNWDAVGERLRAALGVQGNDQVELVDVRDAARPWPEVLARTESAALEHDPDFATLAGGTLGDLMDLASFPVPAEGFTVLIGPGA